jgi:hypothetical protein
MLSGEYERAEEQRPGNLPPPVTYNWARVKTLKRLTYFQMFGLFPFYVILTFKGSEVFASGDLSISTQGVSDIYPFLIFWFILSYVLIFSYIGLICHGYDQASKAS